MLVRRRRLSVSTCFPGCKSNGALMIVVDHMPLTGLSRLTDSYYSTRRNEDLSFRCRTQLLTTSYTLIISKRGIDFPLCNHLELKSRILSTRGSPQPDHVLEDLFLASEAYGLLSILTSSANNNKPAECKPVETPEGT